MDNQKNRKLTYDVFIGHVPKNIEKGKIEQIFSKYGLLVDVLYRYSCGSYGYAIVKFKNQKDAETVLKEVTKIQIDGHEMEVKQGKMSMENGNECIASGKTVSFAEPRLNMPLMENPHFMKPVSYDDDYSSYATCSNGSNPVMPEMMCTHVEDAITFYGCDIHRHNNLENLFLKLNSICPNLKRLLRKPTLKKVYGALFNADNAWYRCSVIQTAIHGKPGVCLVQYIDYGNIDEVCYTNMVDLPEPLKNVAPFAIKCVMANLMHIPENPPRVSYLHHLVNKRMSLYALSSWGIPEYQVLRCTSNGIDVIAELVRNGFAVYKPQTAVKFPSLPNGSDRFSNSKSPENHKSKKASGNKTQKKGADAFNNNKKTGGACYKSACNGVETYSEINNNVKVEKHAACGKSLLSDVSHPAQNCMPKKIIKRGSDITDTGNVPALERATKNVNQMLKIDLVISSVKLVNNIRELFPLHTDDDLINSSISLLQNEVNVTVIDETKKEVEEFYEKYLLALNCIKKCNNQELLIEHKKRREDTKNELLDKLRHFFETFDYSLLDKKKKIQETIIALESNSNAWMNIYLPKVPSTLEDLLMEYNQEKEKKKNIILKARENTNEKQKKFQKILEDFAKEFSLNMGDGNGDESYFISTEGKRGSWALKFEEAMTEYGVALEEESNTSTMQVKDKSHVSVINCILEKLDIPKEKIDAECEIFKKYKALYDDLTCMSDLNTVFGDLCAVQKDIQVMRANCVCNGDAKKNERLLFELHTALLKENNLLENIAKASALHFPELVLEYSDLKLHDYQQNSYLLKPSWDESFFPLFENCNRIEPSYISKFADEPVVIKEFRINSDSEEKSFMKRVITWNEIRSDSLVKIKALFCSKNENILYAVVPSVWETLYDKPLSTPVDYKMGLSLLQQVLAGLCDIHSRGIAHGALHPLAILHKDGKVLLDFNFDRKYLDGKFCLNGINFHVPCAEDLYKSADMYSFGCLVLWVLFPNLSFSSTDQGVPNLNSFQSIIESMLSSKDFASLSALLNINQDLRPSSRVLLSNGFLKDFNIVTETMSHSI